VSDLDLFWKFVVFAIVMTVKGTEMHAGCTRQDRERLETKLIIIINVEFYSHVLMIAGFQQEQPLAAIFLIRNRGAAVLYS
jgi:hypothetical protein